MAKDRAAPPATWRRVSGAGGAMIALSFFLPAVRACGSDVVPVQEVSQMTISPSVIDLAVSLVVYLVPYLFGLLVALAAVLLAAKAQRALRLGHYGLLAATLAALAADIARHALSGRLGDDQAALALPVALSAVYAARAARRGEGGLLCLQWYLATFCVAWFGVWLFTTSWRYGIVLSSVGSAGVAAGAAGELRARTGLGLGALLRQLATASVELPSARGP